MLQCITCAKQTSEDGDEQVQQRGTPTTREAPKNLSAQVYSLSLSETYEFCFCSFFFHLDDENKTKSSPFLG